MIRAWILALALICAPLHAQDSLTSSGGGGGAATQGPAGAQGQAGVAGADGKSAYQVWLDAGNSGTQAQFLAAIRGEQGTAGSAGQNGNDGNDGGIGPAGPAGPAGIGIKGDKGDKGDTGDTGPAGPQGLQGPAGIGETGPAGAQGAAGTASGPHSLVTVPSASYHAALLNASALSTVAGAANRLDFIPFIPSKNLTLNEIAIEVTTLLAASQAHVGIYSDLNGSPNARLAGTTTPLDCATTGFKTFALSNLTMTAGQTYWLAVLTSSTQTLRAIPVAALLPIAAPASGTAISTVRRATSTFASGLPATAPATTPTSAVAPYARLRAS